MCVIDIIQRPLPFCYIEINTEHVTALSTLFKMRTVFYLNSKEAVAGLLPPFTSVQ